MLTLTPLRDSAGNIQYDTAGNILYEGEGQVTILGGPTNEEPAPVVAQTSVALAVSGTSSNVELPVSGAIYPVANIINDGTVEAFFALGINNSVTATTTNIPLPGGKGLSVYAGPNNTYMAAITSTGTTELRITQSNGPACPKT